MIDCDAHYAPWQDVFRFLTSFESTHPEILLRRVEFFVPTQGIRQFKSAWNRRFVISDIPPAAPSTLLSPAPLSSDATLSTIFMNTDIANILLSFLDGVALLPLRLVSKRWHHVISNFPARIRSPNRYIPANLLQVLHNTREFRSYRLWDVQCNTRLESLSIPSFQGPANSVFDLPRLTRLFITESYSGAQLWRFSCLSALEELDMGCIMADDTDGVSSLIHSLPSLHSVRILQEGDCVREITKLTNLYSLGTINYTTLRMLHPLQLLTHLEVDASFPQDPTLAEFCHISKLPQLRSLHVSSPTTFGVNVPQLTRLSLSWCTVRPAAVTFSQLLHLCLSGIRGRESDDWGQMCLFPFLQRLKLMRTSLAMLSY